MDIFLSTISRGNSNTESVMPLRSRPLTNAQPLRASSSEIQARLHKPIDSLTSNQYIASDALESIIRQSLHLQKELQDLLDAQSEGLMAGLETDHNELTSATASSPAISLGSQSPSTRSRRASRTAWSEPRPVRQPKVKKLNIQQARRGILNTTLHLADVKYDEASIIAQDIEVNKDTLTTIDQMIDKSEQICQKIETIEGNKDVSDAESATGRMRAREQALTDEILAAEATLVSLKVQRNQIRAKLKSKESGLQSQLSSYREALRLVEQEATSWLTVSHLNHRPLPPILKRHHHNGHLPGLETNENDSDVMLSHLWKLPGERRTLAMAKEAFTLRATELKRQHDAAEREGLALDEGARVWKEVIVHLRDVEGLVQYEIKGSRTLAKAVEEPKDASSPRVQPLVDVMQKALEFLQTKMQMAHERQWNLLLCCIGAELEAMKQALAMLSNNRPDEEAVQKEKLLSHERATVSIDTGQTSSHAHDDHTHDDSPSHEFLLSIIN